MELKDGKIVATDEEIKILKSEQGKSFMKEKGLEVEKIVGKAAEITETSVMEFLKKNATVYKTIEANVTKAFVANKLGKKEEEITPELLGKDLVLKEELTASTSAAIKAAVAIGLGNVKHNELLLDQVDYSKISLKDGKLDGFDTVVAELKTKYPDLFAGEVSKTPPSVPTNDYTTLNAEQFEKMSQQERMAIPDDKLQALLKS